MQIKITEIPETFLYRVREVGTDDQNQPVRRFSSVLGGEPCRDVLRRSRPGEELILASYTPFKKSGPFKEYGPIYVLAHPNTEIVHRNMLLQDQPENEKYFADRFVLRAYNSDQDIIDAALVTPSDAIEVLERFLISTDVEFVHARFPTFGCFACHIDRA